MSPLSERELGALMERLERGSRETSAGFRTGGMMVLLLFVVCAVVFAVRGAWGVAAVTGGFGAAVMALAVLASRRTGPERAAPVLRAVRERPEDVKLIRHYATSSSTGMFRNEWLEVKTEDGRLVVKATADWEPVMVFLVRRCPGAQVIRAR